jgi:hypothetical protein
VHDMGQGSGMARVAPARDAVRQQAGVMALLDDNGREVAYGSLQVPEHAADMPAGVTVAGVVWVSHGPRADRPLADLPEG